MNIGSCSLRRCSRMALGVLACLLSGTLAGCTPLTVSFTLGERDRPLRETAVFADAGAGDAKVLLIDVRGLLVDQRQPSLMGASDNPVDEIVARLEKAARDDSVKAVVLRIASPGGSVTASDIIYREVRRYAETTRRPVVASLGEIAASGGYYVALAADEIVAEPTSITGSIGVIIQTVNVSDGLAKLGIRSRSITSGANKDMANPLEPPRDAHYALLQSMVDDMYVRFRGLVLERRPKLDRSRVEELTDGRVLVGERAVQAGLADVTGGVREAFDAAKRLAGVPTALLVKYHTESVRPRTPYAVAHEPLDPPAAGTGAGGTEINVFQLRLPGGVPGGSPLGGMYYLWMPAEEFMPRGGSR